MIYLRRVFFWKVFLWSTLLGTITYTLPTRHFWVDDVPFPQVGYGLVPWRVPSSSFSLKKRTHQKWRKNVERIHFRKVLLWWMETRRFWDSFLLRREKRVLEVGLGGVKDTSYPKWLVVGECPKSLRVYPSPLFWCICGQPISWETQFVNN